MTEFRSLEFDGLVCVRSIVSVANRVQYVLHKIFYERGVAFELGDGNIPHFNIITFL